MFESLLQQPALLNKLINYYKLSGTKAIPYIIIVLVVLGLVKGGPYKTDLYSAFP